MSVRVSGGKETSIEDPILFAGQGLSGRVLIRSITQRRGEQFYTSLSMRLKGRASEISQPWQTVPQLRLQTVSRDLVDRLT